MAHRFRPGPWLRAQRPRVDTLVVAAQIDAVISWRASIRSLPMPAAMHGQPQCVVIARPEIMNPLFELHRERRPTYVMDDHHLAVVDISTRC
jgi:hypothetical protein